MWLINSSIGRKFVMSITGTALVLFLLFHLCMNVAAVFSDSAYNIICALLGANWYAVAATVGLVALIAIHFIYALMLTLQNKKARGNNAYATSARPKGVSWASQNLFVIGLIIIGFMVLHLSQFWYKMMFAELTGHHEVTLCGGTTLSPQDGAGFIKYYFSHLWVVIAYLIWYGALWFHLSHGVWSAIQTFGWNNELWIKRLKNIAHVVATVIFAGFAFVTIVFYLKSLCV
jgi:succinate dehydrogenase / fumarate reductase cytochrome b subunit